MKPLLLIAFLLISGIWTLANAPTQETPVPKGSMSARELSEFILATESYLPEKEGIVEVTLILPIVEVRTASTYVPLAGRGHILTFKKIDGKWTRTGKRKWLS